MSENKEKATKLLQELSTKIEDLKKYSERSTSTEMAEIFGNLAKYNAGLLIGIFDLILIFIGNWRRSATKPDHKRVETGLSRCSLIYTQWLKQTRSLKKLMDILGK